MKSNSVVAKQAIMRLLVKVDKAEHHGVLSSHTVSNCLLLPAQKIRRW